MINQKYYQQQKNNKMLKYNNKYNWKKYNQKFK